MRADPGDDVVAEINVTPLVDIVLVLLIIFIVTARFTLPHNIKVDLPHAASSDAPGGEARTTIVTLKPTGEMFFNDQPSSAKLLPAQLAELHRKNADAQLVVNPGYNRARGPVPVWGVRVHAQF